VSEEARKKIESLTLAPNATKAGVRDYVRQVLKTAAGQSIFCSIGPQVGKLKAVGPDNVDVLLEFYSSYEGLPAGHIYVHQAWEALVDARHKKLVIEHLPSNSSLIQLVEREGWTDDAREILIAELRSKPENLPFEWVEAIAELPGIDIAPSVAEAWRRAKREPFAKLSVAKAAVEFGHLDALEALVDSIDDPQGTSMFMEARGTILRRIGFYGSNEQIRTWFAENKDKLVFNPNSKKFEVREKESV